MSEPVFPFAAPPAPGQTVEVAPGILWLRMPLPFRLDHVNVYLLEEDAGWTIVDTGIDDEPTRRLWDGVLRDGLGGKPVARVIVTHFHPDHIGAASYLCERTGAPLLMDETEYLTARVHRLAAAADIEAEQDFYRRHGLGRAELGRMAQRLARYRLAVPDMPPRYAPLRTGDRLTVGTRSFEVMSFGGHSPAQVLLHCAEDHILLAADHILPQISPNVCVAEDKPEDDPLGLYLASFDSLRRRVDDRVLVLPGHRLPYRGLHDRTRVLEAHHAERCRLVVQACEANSLSIADIVPVLFAVELDAHQSWFAFSEALAHVNYLARRGALVPQHESAVTRWSARGRTRGDPWPGAADQGSAMDRTGAS